MVKMEGKMKINQINSVSANCKPRPTNFKGLWGETISQNQLQTTATKVDIYDCQTKEYHPFADESIEETYEVLKKNSTYTTSKESYLAELARIWLKHTGTDIRIKEWLHFTAKEWANYLKNSLKNTIYQTKIIENNLKNLHLEHYLRK